MPPRQFIVSLGVLLLLSGSNFAAPQKSEEQHPTVVAVTHVTVILSPTSGRIADQTVLIRGNRIAAVGKNGAAKLPPGVRIVDGRNKFLVPGFWDSHVHLTLAGESSLQLFIANGVTGVRDMVGDPAMLRDWKDRIARGSLIGPRINMA